MNLTEIHGRIGTTASSKAVLVLDASESAASHQTEIVNLTLAVLSNLPARRIQAIYFLGNAAPYNPRKLANHITQWFGENRGRVSLITPVLDQLDQSDDLRIVVIGAGRIFDLDDWEGTCLLNRTLLATMGDSLQERAVAEEVVRPQASELCRRLDDPVVCLQLSGQGFMPVAWSNNGYRLAIVDECVLLIGENLADYSLAVVFLHDPAEPSFATVTYDSGHEAEVPVRTASADEMPERVTGRLSTEEAKAFEQIVRHEDFICPSCHEPCRWNVLRCRRGGGFGHLVYPSLEQQRVEGFVLFRRDAKGISYESCARGVLPLSPARVAMKVEGSKPVIFRYDEAKGQWVQTQETFECYHGVGADAYAVFI